MVNNELMHFNIKGAKWGVRRYQNKDGSLTPAGKLRYARDAREKEFDKYDESSGKYYKSSKKNGRSDLDVDAERYVKEDMERTKSVANEGRNLASNLKTMNDKAIKNAPKPEVDLSNMSDKELRDAINRKFLEKQYVDLCVPSNVSKGRERASQILEKAGDGLAVTASVLGVALSMKQLLGK